MSTTVGFTYRSSRSRNSTALRKLIDNSKNFLRILMPATGKFYTWPLSATHTVKIFSYGSAVRYAEAIISSATSHELSLLSSIDPIAPMFGVGDTYQIYATESGLTTLITSGAVTSYAPNSSKSFHYKYEILSCSGGYDPSLFVFEHRENPMDNSVTTTFSGLISPEEVADTPRLPVFVPITGAYSTQLYRHHTYDSDFYRQAEVDRAEVVLTAKLVSFFRSISDPESRIPTLSVNVTSATLQIMETLALLVTGAGGSFGIALLQNQSGARVFSDGTYIAGSATGQDVIRITNQSSTQVVDIPITVQNSYSSVVEGSYTWPH